MKGQYAGNQRRLSVTFYQNSTATDVDEISLYVINPNGSASDEYTLGSGDITRSGTGAYYMDYTPAPSGPAGKWFAQWTATLGEGKFTVISEWDVYLPKVEL